MGRQYSGYVIVESLLTWSVSLIYIK
jgi:hypothetical protein